MIKKRKIAIIYTTVASLRDAKKLANHAVSTGHSACVNIIPHALSIYAWQGVIEQSSEYLMLFKTTQKQVNSLKELLVSIHPYEIPAIIVSTAETSEKFYSYIYHQIKKIKKPSLKNKD